MDPLTRHRRRFKEADCVSPRLSHLPAGHGCRPHPRCPRRDSGRQAGANAAEDHLHQCCRYAAAYRRTNPTPIPRQNVSSNVLEIGPGPGAYTRLLVRDADRVVAVEPS